MKIRLNIPGLVLAALPGVPLFMFVIPPLLNATNTHKNLLGFGLVGLILLTWLALLAKLVQKIRLKLALKNLLK